MRSLIRVATAQQALLLVLSGPRLGTRTILSDTPVDIGRGSNSALMLDSDSVSRRHARIEPMGAGHRLTDLGSTNGTYVNGTRVKDHILTDGDRLQIGKALLKYIAGGNIEGAYHEEVQRLMRFDALTGVHNKRHFDENLRIATTAGHTGALSLIVLDIDHFKKVNDTYGHMAGDAVLCATANVVKQSTSPDYLFARVGGEEFAVLCPNTTLAVAKVCAEKIRTAVAANCPTFEEKTLPVTVSLGVAEFKPGSDESPEALYGRADEKLYQAKGSGRNRVCS
ncbi:MAG TPA: GGDEF domain-containing protein [Polyangiaceae bacterium]|nr:GGDEF domain-containing protein [Polyangiaceae bacterium]